MARQLVRRRPIPRQEREEALCAAYWGLVGAAMRWRGQCDFRRYAVRTMHLEITKHLSRCEMQVGGRSKSPHRWDVDSLAHEALSLYVDPLDALIVDEERNQMYAAIKHLTPVRLKVIRQMLRGQIARRGSQSEKNRWKAFRQLRELTGNAVR